VKACRGTTSYEIARQKVSKPQGLGNDVLVFLRIWLCYCKNVCEIHAIRLQRQYLDIPLVNAGRIHDRGRSGRSNEKVAAGAEGWVEIVWSGEVIGATKQRV
jgi:hypothetical protein